MTRHAFTAKESKAGYKAVVRDAQGRFASLKTLRKARGAQAAHALATRLESVIVRNVVRLMATYPGLQAPLASIDAPRPGWF